VPFSCHIFFRQNEGVSFGGKVGIEPGVDIRADGSLVVDGGSMHKSGVRYTLDRNGMSTSWWDTAKFSQKWSTFQGQGQSQPTMGQRQI
jgi:hypothetical protein